MSSPPALPPPALPPPPSMAPPPLPPSHGPFAPLGSPVRDDSMDKKLKRRSFGRKKSILGKQDQRKHSMPMQGSTGEINQPPKEEAPNSGRISRKGEIDSSPTTMPAKQDSKKKALFGKSKEKKKDKETPSPSSGGGVLISMSLQDSSSYTSLSDHEKDVLIQQLQVQMQTLLQEKKNLMDMNRALMQQIRDAIALSRQMPAVASTSTPVSTPVTSSPPPGTGMVPPKGPPPPLPPPPSAAPPPLPPEMAPTATGTIRQRRRAKEEQ